MPRMGQFVRYVEKPFLKNIITYIFLVHLVYFFFCRHWKRLLGLGLLLMLFLAVAFRNGSIYSFPKKIRPAYWLESVMPSQKEEIQSNVYSGASANIFNGEKLRIFPKEQRIFSKKFITSEPMNSESRALSPSCEL